MLIFLSDFTQHTLTHIYAPVQSFTCGVTVSPGHPLIDQAALDVSARALEDLIIEAVTKPRLVHGGKEMKPFVFRLWKMCLVQHFLDFLPKNTPFFKHFSLLRFIARG